MKKTSLFLLLFVSVSSLRAMDEADIGVDHFERLNRFSDQAADLRRRLEEQSNDLDREDQYHYGRSTDRRSTTSSFGEPSDTGWGVSSGSQQTAPEFFGGSTAGDGSTFGADANTPTEAQSEQSVQENVERGLTPLRAEVGQDGSILFARRDGKKRGWNWFSSTTDHQEMKALDAKRRELKKSFDKPNMGSKEMENHLENLSKVNNALRERANRLKDNRSLFGFGDHTSKAKDAQRLLSVSSGYEDYAQDQLSMRRRGEQDAQDFQKARLADQFNAADQFNRRKGRSAADQRAVRGGFNDGVLSREAQGSQDASAQFNRRKGRSAADQRAVSGGFIGGGSPDPFTQPAPERASEQDFGVAGQRTREQMRAKYNIPKSEGRGRNLLDRSSDWAAGNIGGDRDPSQFTTERNNGSERQGRSLNVQDAQERLNRTGFGERMRNRTDNLNRVGRGGEDMARNGGRFQQGAGDLEKAMKDKKWWQF